MTVNTRTVITECKPVERDPAEIRQRNRHILKRLLLICLTIDAVLGALILYVVFLHTAYFNLHHVEVTGNRRLSRAEIIEAAEVHSGVNLLTVDLNAVTDKLRRHPWVRAAVVYRRLPGQMIIEVDERTPRAILAAGKLYYLDEQGEVFTRLFPGDGVDYTVFTGIYPEDLKQNGAEVQELVRMGFTLLDLLERTDTELDPSGIAEVRLNMDEGLAVQTRFGRVVVFGKDQFDLKLHRYGRLKRFLTQRGEWNNARIINLDFEDRALVRSGKTRLQG